MNQQGITMKQLLEAGVHFGHQSRRWNPKMAKYIFTERNGIYIIDLKKTLRLLREALKFVKESVAQGRKVLFVGTKKQARESLEVSAKGCGMFYVNNRWLGGMLTNFKTIRKSVLRLIELEKMWDENVISRYSKKEVSRLEHQKSALSRNLSGVKNMTQLPGLVFIVDPHKEGIAVSEARKLKIPIVAIVDTNCDPDNIDYVIPGNDDAIRAIKLMCDQVMLASIEGLMELQAVQGVAPEGLTTELAAVLGIPGPRIPTPVAAKADNAPAGQPPVRPAVQSPGTPAPQAQIDTPPEMSAPDGMQEQPEDKPAIEASSPSAAPEEA
jgi:small subunit ribosomal protein S2